LKRTLVVTFMPLARVRAEIIFLVLSYGRLLVGFRVLDVVQKQTCEAKLANGDMCTVVVTMDGHFHFILRFDGTTTVSDVQQQVTEWKKSKGHTGPLPRWVLSFRAIGRYSIIPLDGDNKTLISFGLGRRSDGRAEVGTIFVNRPKLLGGVMYGDVVDPQTYDFVVLIFHKGAATTKMGTGTIYGKYVLTAAHVVANKNPKEFRIVLAHRHYTEVALTVSKIHLIDGVYNPKDSAARDLAVVIVHGEGYIPKTKVHFLEEALDRQYQPYCYLAGFGMTEKGGRPSPDRSLVVGKFKAFDDCAPRNKKDYFGCATSRDSPTAACIGDSGGPWFITIENEHWIFGVHHGASNCKVQQPNKRSIAEFTLLSDSAKFWRAYFPMSPKLPE